MADIIWFDRALGAPTVTVAAYGIVFNRAAVEELGEPDYIRVGLVPGSRKIVFKAAANHEKDSAFPFKARQREHDGTVRITNKDLTRLIQHRLRIDLDRAIRCTALMNEETGMLEVTLPDNVHKGADDQVNESGEGDTRGERAELEG